MKDISLYHEHSKIFDQEIIDDHVRHLLRDGCVSGYPAFLYDRCRVEREG